MLSFAVTAFCETSRRRLRGQRILDCILAAQLHPAVQEVVIVDDASPDFAELEELLSGRPKVKLYRNEQNLSVFGNKLESVARCSQPWVVMCDSDNRMGQDFLDRIMRLDRRQDTWYSPSYARPNFDYRELQGTYDLDTLRSVLHHPMLHCCLNTGNQTVPREPYLDLFGSYRNRRVDLIMPNYLNLPEEERRRERWRQVWNANDSFLFNLEWLCAGKRLCVVEGLEYEHHYSGGADSNFARAPVEKDMLGARLFSELRKAAKWA